MEFRDKLGEFFLGFFQLELALWMLLLVLALLLVASISFTMLMFINRNSYATNGKILGAVSKEEKETKQDGTEEIKLKYRLVYEYTNPEGSLRQRIGNDWSSSYKRLTTGSVVKIKVIPDVINTYDSVYFAESNSLRNLCIVALLVALSVIYGNTQSIKAVVLMTVIFGVLSSFGLWFFESIVAKQEQSEDTDTQGFEVDKLFPIESLKT